MKKLILFVTFLVCLSNSGFAQWKIGGKVGVNWSQIVNNFPKHDASDFKQGFSAGVVGSYQFNKWIALQGELLYSMRGYKEKNAVSDVTGEKLSDLVVAQNYIDLPILAKFYPTDLGFNLQAGVQLGFSLSESYKIEGGTITSSNTDKEFLDLGIVLGASYEFNFGMFVDARYILGVTNNYKTIKGMNNRAIQVSLGYQFKL